MGLRDLFKKETTAQKVSKTVKKTFKKTVEAIGPEKPSMADRIFGKSPRVKQVTVTYGGRDDDFD